MIRGFLTGLVWGGVVSAAGLAVISQVAPIPGTAQASRPTQAEPELALSAPAAIETSTPAEAAPAAPEPTTQSPLIPARAALDAPELAQIETETQDLFVTENQPDAPDEGQPAAVQPPAADPIPAGDAVSEPPAAPAAVPAVELIAPEPADEALLMPTPDPSGMPTVAPLPAVLPLSNDDAPAAAEPPLADKVPKVPLAPNPAPVTEIASADLPRLIVPDGKPLTETAPDDEEPALPRIGDPEPAVQPVPEPATPLELFARPFDNPDAKPLFSVLLVDDGAAETDRETLAALPFAITFVVDPLAPNAAEAAAIYRNAGQEVMMQTTAVPAGAVPSDIEQSYQALDMAMPEAVAVLGASGLEADSRQLAASVVPILAAQGRGIVTLDRGLNAVDQAARRDGVPQATIFRLLDASGESVPVIRRYLDRAAFRAAQEGSVVVLGSTRPDTIAALLQWTVEGRAASVALAPISAILRLEN